MRDYAVRKQAKRDAQAAGRGLCPLSQGVNVYGLVKATRPKGEPLPASVCMGDDCAWWSVEAGCCAILAAVKHDQAPKLAAQPASATVTDERDQVPGVIDRVREWLAGERSTRGDDNE